MNDRRGTHPAHRPGPLQFPFSPLPSFYSDTATYRIPAKASFPILLPSPFLPYPVSFILSFALRL